MLQKGFLVRMNAPLRTLGPWGRQTWWVCSGKLTCRHPTAGLRPGRWLSENNIHVDAEYSDSRLRKPTKTEAQTEMGISGSQSHPNSSPVASFRAPS